ncbi:hypothetical protein [Phaeacidiphilus oryzae]|uniref:hypothetical protein n=1 Tax=Phaeacidiphilus oryzae TaxID=348818 RepID=UPI00055E4A3A|nr:hypothetical protein [Phaeacidiphilus oryzae]
MPASGPGGPGRFAEVGVHQGGGWDVAPPPRPQRTPREKIAGALYALLVLVGLTASVVLGSGALSSGKA